MGREVRRVPPNWEHPRYTQEDAPRPGLIGQYKPLYDQSYKEVARNWIEAFDLWRNGKHEAQGDCYFWEYDPPPSYPEYYRPEFNEEPTWYQVYETVSEGTPVTPPFETPEELTEYLSENGDFWSQLRGNSGGPTYEDALAFVKEGWVPTLIAQEKGVEQ